MAEIVQGITKDSIIINGSWETAITADNLKKTESAILVEPGLRELLEKFAEDWQEARYKHYNRKKEYVKEWLEQELKKE